MSVNKKICKITLSFIMLILMPFVSYSSPTATVNDNGTITLKLSRGDQFKSVFNSASLRNSIKTALQNAGVDSGDVDAIMNALNQTAENTIANSSSASISLSETVPSFTPYGYVST
jgi:hypothetical protein